MSSYELVMSNVGPYMDGGSEENKNNHINNNTGKRKRASQNGSAKKSKGEPKAVNRKDNSLNRLTARFMDIISSSTNGIVDLNSASLQLQVQKRRIYDITNVLEGIGLIEKKSKNNIAWSGAGGSSQSVEEMNRLKEHLANLNQQELIIDQQLKDLQNQLKQTLETHTQYTYVTHPDIRHMLGSEDQTLIAVRAQAGTRLEVPDPDCGSDRPYQIFLKSDFPIDVYLVSQPEEEQVEDYSMTQQQQQTPKPPMYDNMYSNLHSFTEPSLITSDLDYYSSGTGISDFYVDSL